MEYEPRNSEQTREKIPNIHFDHLLIYKIRTDNPECLSDGTGFVPAHVVLQSG